MQSWDGLRDEHTLVTRKAALPTVPAHTVGNATQRRRLVVLQRGVYVAEGERISPVVRAAAALKAIAPTAGLVSHHTAARLHGLPVPSSAVEHVTIAREHRRKHHARLRVHTAAVHGLDRALCDGIATTSIARTVIDLCRTIGREDAAWAVDQALHLHLVTLDQLDQAIARLPRASGVGRARRVLASADPGSQSPLETRGRLVLLDGGLPRPESQIRLIGPGGVVYLDLGYREQKLGIELDGRSIHEQPDALLNDRWRQNMVHRLGWRLLRFTWYDVVRRPQWMVDSVRTALG